jgi:glycosyltransferase involved in cell wall biosynthesis
LTVSVVITSFNHSEYIGEALDGVLMQRTDFPVEVLVGDDGSTDGTRDIITGYARRHPDRVFPLFPDKPMGHEGGLIFKALLERARGEYIALLDADDHWLADDKLSLQVALLEEEHDCAFCFHETIWFSEDGSLPAQLVNARQGGPPARLEDLLGAWNPIATSSVLYRNRGVEELPDWLFEITAVDWVLNILNARHGDIAFIDRPMSAYRFHSDGLWSRLGRVKALEETLETLSRVEQSLPSRCLGQFEYARSKLRAMLVVERNIPSGQTSMLVVTGGDDQFLALERRCRSFPHDRRRGRNPVYSEDAIAELEQSRADGAEYLLIPDAQRWWLEFYSAFAAHLDERYTRVWMDGDCTIYSLVAAK